MFNILTAPVSQTPCPGACMHHQASPLDALFDNYDPSFMAAHLRSKVTSMVVNAQLPSAAQGDFGFVDVFRIEFRGFEGASSKRPGWRSAFEVGNPVTSFENILGGLSDDEAFTKTWQFNNWFSFTGEPVVDPASFLPSRVSGSSLSLFADPVSGFASLEQLSSWFSSEELADFAALGFQLVTYRVKGSSAIFSPFETVFDGLAAREVSVSSLV